MSSKAVETMALLASAMKRKGDFPAISSDLGSIIHAMKEEEKSTDAELVDVILSDFALTQKVLRLANSAMYGSFGRTINTITAAIFVLGLETVGHLAMGLKLLDSLTNAADTKKAKVELTKSILAGAVSRNIGAKMSPKDGEAIAVTSLLRDLGKLLVCFYLPDQFEAIAAKNPTPDTEARIATEVLGLAYDEIAKQTSKNWNLPAELTCLLAEPEESASEKDKWAHSIANYSRRYVSAVVQGASPSDLGALASRYAKEIGTGTDELIATSSNAMEELATKEGRCAYREVLEVARVNREAVQRKKDIELQAKPETASASDNTHLAGGLAELQSLKPTLKPSELIGRATAQLFHGLECSRYMMFLHNKAQDTFVLLKGYGAGVDEHLRKLSFTAAYSPDVFHFALEKSVPVYLHDLTEPGIESKLPSWLLPKLGLSKSMLLLPLTSGTKSTGLLYLDWEEGKKSSLTQKELAQLEGYRALLSQALFEIRGA